jgi:hypothetical protein
MSSLSQLFAAVCVLLIPLTSQSADKEKPSESSAKAIVETTLSTQSGQIRQLAFDGDKETYFASEKNAQKTDHFTLIFSKPVTVKSIEVITGKPKGEDQLGEGVVEVSEDGKKFEVEAKFNEGKAHVKGLSKKILAVRVQCKSDLNHPLAIREFVVDSDPAVAIFKYPVEFSVDVKDAPEMKEWAEKTARICEREYTMINEELRSEGYHPARTVKMTIKANYDGVAYASGGAITGAVKWFKAHPDDIGAMVHETTHIVQNYRTPNNPSWLVEGVADYIRFFKYEPGKIGPINANRAHYNGSYRVTAAFLDYLTRQYDKGIVLKLNKAMREGEYKESIFKELTKKTLKELDEEWRGVLKNPKS